MGIKEYFGKEKLLTTITIGLFVIGAVCILYVLFSSVQKKITSTDGNMDCVAATEQIEIKDEHMAGVYSLGDKVKVLRNFYNCNEAKKGEVALFRFSEQIEPVVRWVRGVPGDRYDLVESADKKGSWTISINGEILKDGDQPYMITSNTVPPLKTYALSRGGVLLPNEYILLSNKAPGLSDSSNLGLVQKKDLVGRVVK